jgi:hypothetical protein
MRKINLTHRYWASIRAYLYIKGVKSTPWWKGYKIYGYITNPGADETGVINGIKKNPTDS